MIVCRAPGKLFIAGEYAVLEPGHCAVLVAVDRFVTVTLSEHGEFDTVLLESDLDGGVELACRRSGQSLIPLGARAPITAFAFVLAAIDAIEELLGERELSPRSFRLTVHSELAEPDGRKYGLGSSAAVTVATVAALDRFYRLNLTREDRYRVALLATLAVHPEASGADVAAATWTGWLAYSSPDRWLINSQRAAYGMLSALHAPWPGLAIRHLPEPVTVRLLVGWTGRPAVTHRLAARLDQESGGEPYERFLASTATTVRLLIEDLIADNPFLIKRDIRWARTGLITFDDAMGIGIMTPRLHALCWAAEAARAAAKPSGAGGGDCGIAIADALDQDQIEEVEKRWDVARIQPLRLSVYSEGRVWQ
ncbi:phosphomevalonate kinase [Nocardia sp. NPDC088792]|uniref:phosphomevalonate kinase n=1 Tax=Nocardia sp. NPDC088792 TaxID=3364332 RepID=UPI0037FBE5CB